MARNLTAHTIGWFDTVIVAVHRSAPPAYARTRTHTGFARESAAVFAATLGSGTVGSRGVSEHCLGQRRSAAMMLLPFAEDCDQISWWNAVYFFTEIARVPTHTRRRTRAHQRTHAANARGGAAGQPAGHKVCPTW